MRGQVPGDGETITVRIPLTFRKRGGRKLVMTPDGAAWAPRHRVDDAMVKALARAFRWRKMLDAGVHAALGLVDLYYIMARSTWISSNEQFERLLPRPKGIQARAARGVGMAARLQDWGGNGLVPASGQQHGVSRGPAVPAPACSLS